MVDEHRAGGDEEGGAGASHREAGPGLTFARDLVSEVGVTALVLEDVITILLEDLPADAFPGEDKGEVVLEMIAGSVAPAVEEAGEEECRRAIALVVAIRVRVLADLRVAARRVAASDR